MSSVPRHDRSLTGAFSPLILILYLSTFRWALPIFHLLKALVSIFPVIPLLFNMASATRLPLKSIAFTTTLALGVGASRVDLRNLLLRMFTGPGSKSRIAFAFIVLLNLKNVPFAWHVCLSSLSSVLWLISLVPGLQFNP